MKTQKAKSKIQNCISKFKINIKKTPSLKALVLQQATPGDKIQRAKSKMQSCSSKFKSDIKKRAYTYALDLIKFMDELDNKDLSVQVIARQLLRSGTSVGANIVEAQASSSKREFTNFIDYSLKSANESKFWLALLRESGKESVRPLMLCFRRPRNLRISLLPAYSP